MGLDLYNSYVSPSFSRDCYQIWFAIER